MENNFSVGDVIYFMPADHDSFVFAIVNAIVDGGYLQLVDDFGADLLSRGYSGWYIRDYMKVDPDTPKNRLFVQLKYHGERGAH